MTAPVIGHNGGPSFGTDIGWVAIARAMRDHPVVGFHLFAKPADRNRGAMQPALAFIDLIMECQYERGIVKNAGRDMEILPGQLVGAVSWLANRWNWTPMTVRTWLDKLEAEGMISRYVPSANEKSNKMPGRYSTVISICNYGKYQITDRVEKLAEQHDAQQQYKDNKRNKINKREEKKPVAPPTPPISVGPELPVMAEVPGLNGQTAMIVNDLARWLNPYVPQIEVAFNEVRQAVTAYGESAVREGYMELRAKHADGSLRSPTVKQFFGFCRIAKERAPASAKRGAQPAPSVLLKPQPKKPQPTEQELYEARMKYLLEHGHIDQKTYDDR